MAPKNFIKTLLRGADERALESTIEDGQRVDLIFADGRMRGPEGLEGPSYRSDPPRRVEATDKHLDELLTLRQSLYDRDAAIVGEINRLTGELVHVRHTIASTEAGIAALDSPMPVIKQMPTLANLKTPKVVSEEPQPE